MTMEFHYNIIIDTKRPQSSTFTETFFSILAKLGMKKKSDNLQYNTLVRWADGTNDLPTKHLMFQVFSFFIISCKILCKNPFNLFFSIYFYNFTKIKILTFECSKSKSATHCFIFNLSK